MWDSDHGGGKGVKHHLFNVTTLFSLLLVMGIVLFVSSWLTPWILERREIIQTPSRALVFHDKGFRIDSGVVTLFSDQTYSIAGHMFTPTEIHHLRPGWSLSHTPQNMKYSLFLLALPQFIREHFATSNSAGPIGQDESGVHLPILPFLVLSAWMPIRSIRMLLRQKHRHKHQLCLGCGHDLRASKDRCPECGTAITVRAKA